MAGVLAGAHSGWLVIAVPAAIGSILSFFRSRKIVRLSNEVQVVAADLYIGFASIFLGSIQSMLSQSIYMNEDGAKVIAKNLFAGRQVA